MAKKSRLLSNSYIVFLTLMVAFASYMPAQAQVKKDSTKKILLAKLDKKEAATITIKEANVVYPDLLTGNEDQSLEYIEKFSTNRRDYLIRTYNKGKKFFPKAAKILKKHHIPEEFKVLLALESAFNGNAVSGAGAVGYWQIMDEVAKEYGLTYVTQPTAEEKKAALALAKAATKKEKIETKKEKKIIVKDDRNNFNKATNTAARYLKDRCRNLDNNWLLIVASYNCGVGNVWNAMKKTGKANPDFWDVKNYLPTETRAYVMNFIALNVVFNNYQKFASNTLNFKPVKVKVEDLEDMKDVDGETTLNKR
jgi:membrane-bound lytic murein transglycosylase D